MVWYTCGENESKVSCNKNGNLYTKNSNIKVPYFLDGLIYTPQEQKYTTVLHETKYRIYKWKPPNQNTIDFFIES
mgnify:CR=1 FL=1